MLLTIKTDRHTHTQFQLNVKHSQYCTHIYIDTTGLLPSLYKVIHSHYDFSATFISLIKK